MPVELSATDIHKVSAPVGGVSDRWDDPRLATEEHLSRDGLSRRLRETLQLVLEGLGERQIAKRLAIAPTTVHGYVGELYKHFQVAGPAELMRYFIRRQPTRCESDGANPVAELR